MVMYSFILYPQVGISSVMDLKSYSLKGMEMGDLHVTMTVK